MKFFFQIVTADVVLLRLSCIVHLNFAIDLFVASMGQGKVFGVAASSAPGEVLFVLVYPADDMPIFRLTSLALVFCGNQNIDQVLDDFLPFKLQLSDFFRIGQCSAEV